MEVFLDALLDALKDTLLVLPILYLAYLLVSYFSHNNNEKYAKILHNTNKAGPVIGAFLGCIPQCGFSSVMSQLYSKKIITLGTLMAVFLATSDEAIPIMLSEPEFIPDLLLLLAVKVVYGIIIGYTIDGVYKLIFRKKSVKVQSTQKKQECLIAGEEGHSHLPEEKNEIDKELEHIETHCCCGVEHSHHYEEETRHNHSHSHCCATNIFLDALQHTAVIIAYVFIATLVINLINGYCGGLAPLQSMFTSNIFVQIVLASLIGLIPNCAASVFVVELYMSGVIYFPALVAGLCAGAGVGLIVLYTANYKKVGTNIFITVLLYLLALLAGIITNFIPIW